MELTGRKKFPCDGGQRYPRDHLPRPIPESTKRWLPETRNVILIGCHRGGSRWIPTEMRCVDRYHWTALVPLNIAIATGQPPTEIHSATDAVHVSPFNKFPFGAV